MNQTALNLPCFAKINRSLKILGKREDGYHELRTIFQTISVRDQLILINRDDGKIKLSCNEKSVPVDETNLVFRAAIVLRERAHIRAGVDIALLKRIPTKGGLGGASSNAAVALMGLNVLWKTQLATTDLEMLAKKLGADVPFFLLGGCALGEGTGSTVSALRDCEQQQLMVITPNVSVATREAYKLLSAASLTTSNSASILTSSFAEPVLNDCDQWPVHNDFEAVIFEREPEIERAKNALIDAGARGALLTGSGSSVFGIFDDKISRQRALDRLRTEAGWRVYSCSTISRSEYFGAMGSAGVLLS